MTLTTASPEQLACAHEDFGAEVRVGRMLDTGRFIAEITISCSQCQLPFRFKGVQAGVAWERPTCSIEGLTLNAPIEPELVRVLQAGATFEMPPLDRSRH